MSTMSNVQLFENSIFGRVRVIPDGDSFWVVGTDVLSALEYPSSESHALIIFASIPDEWKDSKPIDARCGTLKMLCLSEQGLYSFLGRSDKPKALLYQKWIVGKVVPSIRKSGSYNKPESTPLTVVDKFKIWKSVLETVYEGNQLTLALDKCAVRLTGESALKIAEVQLVAQQ